MSIPKSNTGAIHLGPHAALRESVVKGSLIRSLFILSFITLTGTLTRADEQNLVFHLRTQQPAEKVFVASEIHDWDAQDPSMQMQKLGSCEFLLTLPKPLLGHLQYKFVVDGNWQTDPDNPHTLTNGVGTENSVFLNETLEEDPALELQKDVRPWDQSTLILPDQNGLDRQITVLRPPGGFQKQSTVTVYFQDGGEYLEKANAANLIANLSSEPGMPAITAVFIPPRERLQEYGHDDFLGQNAENYARFVATTVVPAVERKYGIRGTASTRLIMGPSFGGLISLYTGLKYPTVFGNIASQSASIWRNPELIQDLMQTVSKSHVKPRLFLQWGSLENPGTVNFNQIAAQGAQKLGLPIKAKTIPAMHNWLGWRNGLSEILRTFFKCNSH